MNHTDPKSLRTFDTAFTGESGETLQTVRDRLAQNESGIRRRDLLSALDRLVALSGKPLSAISSSTSGLRLAFARVNAPAAGISRKSLQNIKSNVLQAVKRYGTPKLSLTRRIPMTPAWSGLVDLIGDSQRRYGLHRIACYGSAVGIDPGRFAPSDLIGFHSAVEREGVLKDPKKTVNQAIAGWNWCSKHIPSWPKRRLGSPFLSTRYRLSIEDFPAPFQSDCALWRGRLSSCDASMFDGPIQKHRPVTIECQTNAVLRLVSLLVAQGIVQLDELNKLEDIVVPTRVKAGLFAMRNRGVKTSYMRQTALIMLKIARHHCHLPQPQIEQLQSFVRHLPRQRGMTDKNLTLLKQFDDPKNVERLFDFPGEERRRGLRERNPLRRAKRFERALFVEILLWSGLRMQNARSIKINDNIRYSHGECILSFNKSEMKNGSSFEHHLPLDVAKALKEFITVHRPLLPGSGGPYLFPGPTGEPKHHSTLARDFCRVFRERCGLTVNPHLVRHIIAEFLVSEDPTRIFMVSQHLGHKTVETTRDAYLPNGSRSASRAFAKILEERLGKIRKSRKGEPK